METGRWYNYDPEKKTFKPERKLPKGLSPRQQKIKRKHQELDKTGSDPFWPIRA